MIALVRPLLLSARFPLIFLICGVGPFVMAQTMDVRLSLDTVTVDPGGSADILVRTSNFDSIVSLQFSLGWNTSVAAFVNVDEADLSSAAVGTNDTDEGRLRFSWFSPDGFPKTLADGSGILRLTLRAVGPAGSSTDLTIIGEPLEIQVFRGTAEPGEFREVNLRVEPGQFRVSAPFSLGVQTQDVVCFGDSSGIVSLSTSEDTTGLSFVWTDVAGQVVTELTALPAGTYQLTVRDADGELVFATSATINQPDAPLAWEEPDVRPASCTAADGIANLSVVGGRSPYSYMLGSEENQSGNFGNLSPGTYLARVADAGGCELEVEVVIPGGDPPILTVADSLLSLCGVNEVELSASADREVDYRWSNGATTATTRVTTPGIYTVVGSAGNDCRDTARVEVLPGGSVEARLVTDLFPLCPGDTLDLELAGGETYEWLDDPPGLLRVEGATAGVAPDTTTLYRVAVSTDCGADTLGFSVTVFEVLATAGPDTCIAPGETLELYASGGIFYTWAPTDFPVSNPNIPDPEISPEATTVYPVLIEDVNGCLTEDEITVLLAENPIAAVRAVNAITPNGDGRNDVLEFRGAAKFGRNSLRIYNRWGRLVYNKLNYQDDDERFDGTYLGEPLPPGTYYYVLEFAAGTIKQSLLITR